MAAPSKSWVTIADSQVDADSPGDTVLVTGFRDDLVHLREWLGMGYTAAQNHDHDGVNSKLVGSVGDGAIGGWQLAFFTAGGTLLFSNNTERSSWIGTTWTKYKETDVIRPGTLRVKFSAHAATSNSHARIYMNGAAKGTDRTLSGSYVVYSEDITISQAEIDAGGLLQVYGYGPASGETVYVMDFQFYYQEFVEFVSTAGY